MSSFVCAFRGRRDSYQVPVALAEAGLLDQFITDAYTMPWMRTLARFAPASVRAKADFRWDPRLPAAQVSCLWGTTVLEHLRHRLNYSPALTFQQCDRRFSLAAARRALHTRADLFLYSPYAWEAFTTRYSHAPRKVLFQYHPHVDFEELILQKDSHEYPAIGESFSGNDGGGLPENLKQRERDAWHHADLILCASSFTRRSLVEAGCDEQRCRIVPYGIDLPQQVHEVSKNEGFQVVFVGSGGQRKGLHHLLMAWKNARLPKASKLTLVCRVMDRGVAALLAQTPRVELRRGVTGTELQRIYASSNLFAMPSLVEGFGQVYLEALAQGCPVIGTQNTCLPDLGGEDDGIFLVPPGDVDALTEALERLAATLPGNSGIRMAARNTAQRFPWAAFRKNIIRSL